MLAIYGSRAWDLFRDALVVGGMLIIVLLPVWVLRRWRVRSRKALIQDVITDSIVARHSISIVLPMPKDVPHFLIPQSLKKVITYAYNRGNPELRIKWVTGIGVIVVTLQMAVAVVAVIILFGWPWLLVNFWPRISLIMEVRWLHEIATIALFITGFLLYISRVYLRPMYGLAEIIIGIVGCWVGLNDLSRGALPTIIVLAGGVYVIVRGFDNLIDDQSLNTSKNDSSDSTKLDEGLKS